MRVTPGWRIQRQRGLSLVEMMVGIAVGLFIVAAATLVVSTQLGDNRRLLLEAQLQQDLRASADIVARDLRRAGSSALASVKGTVWYPGTPGVTANEYGPSSLDSGDPASIVTYSYYRDGDIVDFGFRLDEERLETLIGANWQELTDRNIMRVTAFTVTPREERFRLACPKLCTDGTMDCWPDLVVRSADIDITAQSATDADVVRSFHSEVRLRNDFVDFNDPGVPGSACP